MSDKRRIVKEEVGKGFFKVGGCSRCNRPAVVVVWFLVREDFRDYHLEAVFYCEEHRPVLIS